MVVALQSPKLTWKLPKFHLTTALICPHMAAMATPGERERVDAAAADAAQRLRGKVMAGLSCKAEEAPAPVE